LKNSKKETFQYFLVLSEKFFILENTYIKDDFRIISHLLNYIVLKCIILIKMEKSPKVLKFKFLTFFEKFKFLTNKE